MHTLAAVLTFLGNLGCLSVNNGNLSVVGGTEACQAPPQSMITLTTWASALHRRRYTYRICVSSLQLSPEVGLCVGEGTLSHQTE